MTNPTKATDIKYVNKDFEGFKRDLMRYAQAHFSGSFKDFNEASPGMAVLELQAYVADVLAFYMDQQFLEMKKETAKQIENVEAFAKMRGYRPRGKRAATVKVKFAVEVPAAGGIPDPRFLPIISAGSQVQGPNNSIFELLEDLDLTKLTGDNAWEYRVSRKDDNTQTATHFAVRAEGDCVGAQTVAEILTVGEFTPYLKLRLGQSDIMEVIDVIDEQGNRWYEVDYLAQDAVMQASANAGTDSATVPYVLRYTATPRRFVVDRNLSDNTTYLQFGNGDGLSYNDELIPNVAQLALPIAGRKTFTNFALDPQNFLKTSTLGLSPYNTRMLIRYRIAGGSTTNADAGTINKVLNAVFNDFGDKSDISYVLKVNSIKNSVQCVNLEASTGGGEAETIAEIKANSDSYFAAQNRAVTKDDYLTHLFSIPAKYGKVEKACVNPSEFNPYAVDLHILTLDANGWLTKPTPTLQENVKTYFDKLRMLTEGVNILSAYVINIGVNFGVVISPRYNRSEVLTGCLSAIKEHLKTANLQIGQPLILSEMEALLQNISGVISVYKFEVSSNFGINPITKLTYAGAQGQVESVSFDVRANTKNGIVYAPPDAVFEVRYPDIDLVGESR